MNERLPYLREKTSKLTSSPGVYLMRNRESEIIYIGKAKNLHNRVTSYFRRGQDHLPKVWKMVSNVNDYEFIVTDSEFEALLLECSLIKQHKPKYNILLKDDKGYHYIRISDEEYPRITNEKNTKQSGKYLGPYTSGDIFELDNVRGHTGYTGTSLILDPDTNTAVIILAHRVHPHDEGATGRLRGVVASIAAASIGR